MLKSYGADVASIGESGVAVPFIVRYRLQTSETFTSKTLRHAVSCISDKAPQAPMTNGSALTEGIATTLQG